MSRPGSATEALPERIHLVGIGGIGLSAIARVLALRGHTVSGSDLRITPLVEELAALGVVAHDGHAAEHADEAELVVISSAIPASNPEVVAAREAGVPVLKRQAFVARMLAGSRTVAVAGTHGKTTTSAMIAATLDAAGLSPSFIVGGVLPGWETNAHAGASDWFVIEADEYDRMFHGLTPEVAVVTNVEMDHPDCYRNLDEIREAFAVFMRAVPPGGHIVACADSPELGRVLDSLADGAAEVLTYGLSTAALYRLVDVEPEPDGGVSATLLKAGRPLVRLRLAVPGVHNALNAAGAWLAARLCGADGDVAAEALATFRGVQRRFEVKGEAWGVTVVDDYAHHPTEIRATLASARARYGDRRLWTVFQPHTYSRTRALFGEFAAAFGDADVVLLADIFRARASEQPTVSSAELAAAMDHADARYEGPAEAITATLLEELRPGDVLLTLGAGDGYLIGERVLCEFQAREGR